MKYFKKNPYGTNEIYEGEGYFLSFQTQFVLGGVDSWFGPDSHSGETALRLDMDDEGKDCVWCILNGDHRKAYEEAIPKGLSAVIEVYTTLKAGCGSSWATDDHEEMVKGFLNRMFKMGKLDRAIDF